MAISPYKTFLVGEILTAADLNASFAHITDNALALISPLTGNLDMNGTALIVDADGDTFISATTDDVLAAGVSGVELAKFDFTTASSVNGVTLKSAATGNDPQVLSHGSDTNIDLDLVTKGTGIVRINGGRATPGWVFVEEKVASASASIDFTDLTEFESYRIEIQQLSPSTDSVSLWMRVDANNGASFDTGSVYSWLNASNTNFPTAQDIGNTTAAWVLIGDSAGWRLGTGTNERFIGYVDVMFRGSASQFPQVQWIMSGLGDAGLYVRHDGCGGHGATIVVNAVQFLCSSGNIATGTFRLYGMNAVS